MIGTRVFRVLALCVACLVTAAFGQAREFNIPAGELKVALDAYAKQSGVQLIYRVEDVSGVKSKGASGALSNDEALSLLLEDTGFSSHRDSSGAIAVVRVAAKPPAARSGSAETKELIMVTAQKREERAQDVPISIVAMGADELSKRGVTSFDDLSRVVPGLAIRSTGTFTRQITMRGVSNTFGGSSLIGVYIDEAPATSPQSANQLDIRTYDLDRVEVLRGPQGTLYGEGSAGGTIRFITKDPRFDRFEMKADVSVMTTEDGSPSNRVESVINLPIAQDFAVRVAGTFEQLGGWIDQPAVARRDVNNQNLADIRVKALWQPNVGLSAKATFIVHRNDGAPNKMEDEAGNFSQVFNQTTTPTGRDDYDLYNLTLTKDFANSQFLSATSYVTQYKAFDNTPGLRQYDPPPTPPRQVLSGSVLDSRNLSQEFRLVSTGQDQLHWTTGAYWQNTKFDSRTGYTYFGPPGPLPPSLGASRSAGESQSWAVFADTSYDFSKIITAGAGLRYFKDRRTDIPTGQAGDFKATSPRVYGQYKPDEAVMAYASASKGFRSGGFNALHRPPYDPENIWTYELGLKTTMLDGQLTADSAIFYTNYKDYQVIGVVLTPTGGFNITSNAGDARIRGIEFATTWHPGNDWFFSFNGDLIDTEFVAIRATNSSYVVGDPLDQFPKYQFTFSAQKDFTWMEKRGFARLDFNGQGRMTFRNRNALGPTPWYFSQSDVIQMLNLNVGLDWNRDLKLGAFVRNLLNDRGYVGSNVIEGNAARATPRTVGLNFGVRF